MERNLFENARDAVSRFTQNRDGGRKANEEDMQAAKQAIQSAYSQCSQQEKQQLQQLEQQLEKHHQSLR
ncbi:DUF3813 domain-containing protein [Halobacillus locisalis]|uniref:DUF3813 domain-containing protein n=1 Tax=Halobacillus locisalis TaxID=220753 RepID=A0A838CRC6_9BACI|nr:DUF3813 domain-containing protein [Halobacillus locisalis]MBA2174511.1 DUF3813 domain-containing protein [Halobacillus locisalis]